MASSDWPLSFVEVFVDAGRLRPHHSLGLIEDVRWLFGLKLMEWLSSSGLPVLGLVDDRLSLRICRRSTATIYPGAELTYSTGLPGRSETITGDFCLGYGYDTYSHHAINYRHQHLQSPTPAHYVQHGPLSLGNFAVRLDRVPVGHVVDLPGHGVRACTKVEWAHGKKRSVQGWLGVWFDQVDIPPSLLRFIESMPTRRERLWPGSAPRERTSLLLDNLGDLGGDDAALRQLLGFPKKGQPIGELILLRSVREVFEGEVVLHRYHGKEMQRLELDVFVPGRKLAFEYQGQQHFERLPHWHGETGFLRQQERDKRKQALCALHGYALVYFESGSDLRREGVIQALRSRGLIAPEYEA